MKFSKFFRIFKVSLKLYLAGYKRNIFLTISVAVSVFLFLVVALYKDFDYATYMRSNSRIQDNYIAFTCWDENAFEKLIDEFKGQECLYTKHAEASASYDLDYDIWTNITYNVISISEFVDGAYIYSRLDAYGNNDPSNEYNYEKFELVAGTGEFTTKNEVIISEEYANLLADDINDVLGMQIEMGYNGPMQVYTVIGIYRQNLTETRMNDEVYNKINSLTLKNAEDFMKDGHNNIIFTVIAPINSLPAECYQGYGLYVFFENNLEYEKLQMQLMKFELNNQLQSYYSYISPESLEIDADYKWTSNSQIKAVLMLTVAVISGISLFGTMVNAIGDRRKEIGIKRALGANDGDIMLGFVIENMINSLIAIILAIALVAVIFLFYILYQRQVLMIDYTIDFYPVTIILFVIYTFSSVLGFSLIPAYSATQINIIDTLRDE